MNGSRACFIEYLRQSKVWMAVMSYLLALATCYECPPLYVCMRIDPDELLLPSVSNTIARMCVENSDNRTPDAHFLAMCST